MLATGKFPVKGDQYHALPLQMSAWSGYGFDDMIMLLKTYFSHEPQKV